MESKFVKARNYTNMITINGEVYSLFYDENHICNDPCLQCDLHGACYQDNDGPNFIFLCTPQFAPSDMMFKRIGDVIEFLPEVRVLMVR